MILYSLGHPRARAAPAQPLTGVHVKNVCKVFTGLKGLSFVTDALSSAGAIMCVVYALRSGQKEVITVAQKRICLKFTASSTL